ncbi:MAG: M1 family metallopeptidase [Candidatus Eremiobacterota bacterium]
MKKLNSYILYILIALFIIAGCGSNSTDVISLPTATVTPSLDGEPPQSDPVIGETPQPGIDNTGSAYFPDLGNGGYDIKSYDMALNVDVQANYLTSTVNIKATAKQALSSFTLDFKGYTVTAVSVNEQPAQYSRYNTKIRITPVSYIPQNQTFSVSISYNGDPTDSSFGGNGAWTYITKTESISVLSEPNKAYTWYPCNNIQQNKALYTFKITVPSQYIALANGVLVSQSTSGSNTTYSYKARDPIAPYLVTIGIGKLTVENITSAKGITIKNYLPVPANALITRSLAKQAEMIDFFSGKFGDYPFEIYGAYALPVADSTVKAQDETQTVSTMSTNVLAVEDRSGEFLAAHEMVHQWFGDSVTPKSVGENWIKEGAATLSEGLWAEHTDGGNAYLTEVKTWYKKMALDANPQIYNPPQSDILSDAVYNRGALVYAALRAKFGDTKFFLFLQTLTKNYKNSNISSDDFIKTANEVFGENLQSFFDGWLKAQKIPDIPELGLKQNDPSTWQ